MAVAVVITSSKSVFVIPLFWEIALSMPEWPPHITNLALVVPDPWCLHWDVVVTSLPSGRADQACVPIFCGFVEWNNTALLCRLESCLENISEHLREQLRSLYYFLRKLSFCRIWILSVAHINLLRLWIEQAAFSMSIEWRDDLKTWSVLERD